MHDRDIEEDKTRHHLNNLERIQLCCGKQNSCQACKYNQMNYKCMNLMERQRDESKSGDPKVGWGKEFMDKHHVYLKHHV
uniref:Uncharacterized protein n=1 Tax=Rhizophora mucronata TaxID=61149 RepID=A0A2P2N8G0_RHIMU